MTIAPDAETKEQRNRDNLFAWSRPWRARCHFQVCLLDSKGDARLSTQWFPDLESPLRSSDHGNGISGFALHVHMSDAE